MELARLGYSIDSSGALKAESDLDKMSGAAGRAESTMQSLKSRTMSSSNAMSVAASAANTQARATDKAATSLAAQSTAARANAAAMHAVARANRIAANSSRNLAFQVNDVVQSLALGVSPLQVALQQGPQIAQIENLRGAFRQLGRGLVRFVGAAGPAILSLGGLALAIKGLQDQFNEGRKDAISFASTIEAIGSVVADRVTDLFTTGPLAGLTRFLKQSINDFTNDFMRAAGEVVNLVGGIGASIMDIGSFVATGVSNMFKSMVNTALEAYNFLGTKTGFWEPAELYKLDQGGNAAEDLKKLSQKILENFTGGDKVVQDFVNDVFKKAVKIQNKKDDKDKKDKKDPAVERYKRVTEAARERIMMLEAEEQALFMTDRAAAELLHHQRLMNQAQANGTKLTAEQVKELGALAAEMARAEERIRNTREAIEFAKSATRSFLGDLKNGLQEGMSFWEAFGNAALNVLDKIVNKLLDDVVDALFQVNGASGTGGGFLSSLGSVFGTIFGGARANGGPVRAGQAYMVGERGPELFKPNQSGSIVPNHALPKSDGSMSTSGDTHQTFNFYGSSDEVISEVQRIVSAGQKNTLKAVPAATEAGIRKGAVPSLVGRT